MHNIYLSLWSRLLTFWPLAVSEELRAWHVQDTYQFLASYGYPFLSYVWLDLITLPSRGTRQLRMRRITRLISGGENDPHFWNPWPQFTYSLCHFQGAKAKFKPSYVRKIAFMPLSRLQSLLRMRSITWPVHRGSPKTTNFWPRLIYSLYNFYGATMTIKGSFILEHRYVKRDFRPQKIRPVKIGPQNGCFFSI